jgi:hypothetical protein
LRCLSAVRGPTAYACAPRSQGGSQELRQGYVNQYYSIGVGPLYIIVLTHYFPYTENTPQYKWFEKVGAQAGLHLGAGMAGLLQPRSTPGGPKRPWCVPGACTLRQPVLFGCIFVSAPPPLCDATMPRPLSPPVWAPAADHLQC